MSEIAFETAFPQYLNAPIQIIKWESDELAIAVVCYLFAMMTWIYFLPIVILGPWYYIKAKKHYPRGFLRHIFYYIGLAKFNGYPDFFVKEFRE